MQNHVTDTHALIWYLTGNPRLCIVANIRRMNMNSQQLLNKIEILPPELQKQVYDFVLFLYRQQQQKQFIKKRTVGEYKDKIRIHEDFDDPLKAPYEQYICSIRMINFYKAP